MERMQNDILRAIASGKGAFAPESDSPESAARFQDVVEALQRLASQGLIAGLSLQRPSKSRENHGFVLSAAVSKGITDRGRMHLFNLSC